MRKEASQLHRKLSMEDLIFLREKTASRVRDLEGKEQRGLPVPRGLIASARERHIDIQSILRRREATLKMSARQQLKVASSF